MVKKMLKELKKAVSGAVFSMETGNFEVVYTPLLLVLAQSKTAESRTLTIRSGSS